MRNGQEGAPPFSTTLQLTENDDYTVFREKLSNFGNRSCFQGILQVSKAAENNSQIQTASLAHGRFLSVDTCQYAVGNTFYQYARIKKSPIMTLANVNRNFSQIIVVLNHDASMNFIFLMKSAQYENQTND